MRHELYINITDSLVEVSVSDASDEAEGRYIASLPGDTIIQYMQDSEWDVKSMVFLEQAVHMTFFRQPYTIVIDKQVDEHADTQPIPEVGS